MDPARTLVAVFDSARAGFFEYKQPHGKLVRVLAEVSSGLHHDRRAIESDKPGRGFSSAGGTHHSYESEHDPRKLEKHDFVRALARAIDAALDAHQFASLVIVAPARSVGEFRSVASDKVKKTVWREVEKDFAHLTDPELERHLVPILQAPAS
ncbi:MAG: host attachment protein [Alphaproteobacteria bacterium]|nr:host attachment protein [Alphaproteobacteria bacterium]MBV9694951.1 host attachment protein [Alphaproteobacteria bacterium]